MITPIGKALPFCSKEQFGGKGSQLIELGPYFPIPEGFILSTHAFRHFVNANKLSSVIASVDEKKIADAFINAHFPKAIQEQLLQALDDLQQTQTNGQAVRSSGIDEDGATSSFAGQHDTFFAHLDEQSVFTYIKQCYTSLYSQRSLEYRRQLGLPAPQAMAVVIQNIKDFESGFVAYSAAPFDLEGILVEAAPGHCKMVVDGGTVDSYKIERFDKSDQTIREKIAHKTKKWTFTDRLKLIDHIQNTTTLAPEQIQKVAQLARNVEAWYALDFPHERIPQDIEGGFTADGRIYLTQTRPITGMDFIAPDIQLPKLTTQLAHSHNVSKAGVLDLPCIIVDDVDPLGKNFTLKDRQNIRDLDQQYQRGYVLITPETNPYLDSHLTHCKGIVATRGGVMSHAGATARDRGLLFLGLVEGDLQQLQHGEVICVGATKDYGIVGYR